ncbi:hypothetical protein PINS_up007110 [Pythium insidiosum]|nr:hypothetical protein PINS_up007110 [Pythium insidiosum]
MGRFLFFPLSLLTVSLFQWVVLLSPVPVRASVFTDNILDITHVCTPDIYQCPHGGLSFRDRHHKCEFTPCEFVPSAMPPSSRVIVDPTTLPTFRWLGNSEFYVPALRVSELRRGHRLERRLQQRRDTRRRVFQRAIDARASPIRGERRREDPDSDDEGPAVPVTVLDVTLLPPALNTTASSLALNASKKRLEVLLPAIQRSWSNETLVVPLGPLARWSALALVAEFPAPEFVRDSNASSPSSEDASAASAFSTKRVVLPPTTTAEPMVSTRAIAPNVTREQLTELLAQSETQLQQLGHAKLSEWTMDNPLPTLPPRKHLLNRTKSNETQSTTHNSTMRPSRPPVMLLERGASARKSALLVFLTSFLDLLGDHSGRDDADESKDHWVFVLDDCDRATLTVTLQHLGRLQTSLESTDLGLAPDLQRLLVRRASTVTASGTEIKTGAYNVTRCSCWRIGPAANSSVSSHSPRHGAGEISRWSLCHE